MCRHLRSVVIQDVGIPEGFCVAVNGEKFWARNQRRYKRYVVIPDVVISEAYCTRNTSTRNTSTSNTSTSNSKVILSNTAVAVGRKIATSRSTNLSLANVIRDSLLSFSTRSCNVDISLDVEAFSSVHKQSESKREHRTT